MDSIVFRIGGKGGEGWAQDKRGYRLVTSSSQKHSSKCVSYRRQVILGFWVRGSVMVLITSPVLNGHRQTKWIPRKLGEGKRAIRLVHRLSKVLWCHTSGIWCSSPAVRSFWEQQPQWKIRWHHQRWWWCSWQCQERCLFMSLLFAFSPVLKLINSLYMIFKKVRKTKLITSLSTFAKKYRWNFYGSVLGSGNRERIKQSPESFLEFINRRTNE